MKKLHIKKVFIFIGITYFFSWTIAILFYAFGGKWNTPASFIMAVIYMFIPMLVTILVHKGIYKEPLKILNISLRINRWFFIAWLIPPAIAFATIGVSLAFRGVTYSPEMAGLYERFKSLLTPEQLQEMESQASVLPIHPFWISLLQGLIAGITVNAVAGFGEELGWRGLLQKELCNMGFFKSSTIIGFIWGLWHAPIVLQGLNYPEHPVAGLFMMILWCILLSPIFSYVRLRGKSVIAAAIIHGSLNGNTGLAIMIVKGGNDLIIGVTGLAGFIVLIFVNIVLFLYDRFITKESVIMEPI